MGTDTPPDTPPGNGGQTQQPQPPAEEALESQRWVDNAFMVFGKPPELVKAALGGQETFTRDQAQAAIEAYLARPVS